MSTSKWMGLSVAAACAVVAALAWQRAPTADENGQARQQPGHSGWFQAQTGAPRPSGDQAPAGPGIGAAGMTGDAAKGRSPLESVAPPRFTVDEHGQLVLNSQTRDGIEQVAALHGDDRDQARAKLAEATQDLPPGAQRAVQDLYQRYQQYMQAARQAFPPEQQEHMTLPQAEEAFEKLQKVRETYMGEAGKSLWARDDAVTRKLLDYSGDYIKQHPDASLEQATLVAQDRYAREMEDMKDRPLLAPQQQPPQRPPPRP